MARSVYIPSQAAAVAYAIFEPEYPEAASDDFDLMLDDAQGYGQELYPSLGDAKRYIGREGRVFLDNKLCSIGVSEYNGVVAVWAIPEAGYPGLAERFVSKLNLQALANCFGMGVYQAARFSNGGAMYQPLKGAPIGRMGLGYSSKEGAL